VQLTRHLKNLLTCLASYQVFTQTYTVEAIFAATCCKNTVVSPSHGLRNEVAPWRSSTCEREHEMAVREYHSVTEQLNVFFPPLGAGFRAFHGRDKRNEEVFFRHIRVSFDRQLILSFTIKERADQSNIEMRPCNAAPAATLRVSRVEREYLEETHESTTWIQQRATRP
jgi:hypothetical protein